MSASHQSSVAEPLESVDALYSSCHEDEPAPYSPVYDLRTIEHDGQLVLSMLPSKSLEYTSVSIPSSTSFTSKSTSIEPEMGFRPVFLTVKLTNLLPSPILAAPVAGS